MSAELSVLRPRGAVTIHRTMQPRKHSRLAEIPPLTVIDRMSRVVACPHLTEGLPVAKILAAETVDVRFPTSEQLDGSDAMNPDPDYSAAYLSLTTDAGDGHVGAGFVF